MSRAWSIKEAFSDFWNYSYAGSARTLKRHLPGLLAYFRQRITNAVAEGLNFKIQIIKTNARGFRNFEKYWIAIFFIGDG